MVAYKFDKRTLEFLGDVKLENDPIEYKPIMLPDCVTIQPPEEAYSKKNDKVAIWNGKKWTMIDDYRGVWYQIDNNNQEETIEHLYDNTLGADWREKKELIEKRILYKYDSKECILTCANGMRLTKFSPQNHSSGLDAKYLKYENRGYVPFLDKILGSSTLGEDIGLLNSLKLTYDNKGKENFKYKDKEFQVDESSLTNMRNYVTLLENTDKTIDWITTDNSAIALNANDLNSIVKGVLERQEQLFNKYQEIKNQLRSVKNFEDILALCPKCLEILRGEAEYEFEI